MAKEKLPHIEEFTNRNIRFYLTGPQVCPYLPNRLERKVFATLNGIDAAELNQALTHAGFRRSQNISYRPSCDMCASCVSVRINVDKFEFNKNWRRILNKNKDIYGFARPPVATEERYNLLKKYLNARHLNAGMSDMDEDDFVAMIEDCTSNTILIDYRLLEDCEDGQAGKLIGCSLLDELSDGRSLIYSFFDPDLSKRSLGSFFILDHVREMKSMELPYIYLGYWIKGSRKMEYKTRFKPLEVLGPQGWADFVEE